MGEAIRVLGVNGSPRPYGESMKLLKLALAAAEVLGAETKLIRLYEYRIEDCWGCVSDDVKLCRVPCPVSDDFPKLARLVEWADAIIISTPVYWYAPSGVVKKFIDRLTCFENMIHHTGRSHLEGKVAGFIATGNDSGTIMAIAWMMVTLNSMGVHIPPWALAYYHGREGDALSDPNATLDAANVGRVVVLAAKALKAGGVSEWYDPSLRRLVEEWKPRLYAEAEEIRRRVLPGRLEAIRRGYQREAEDASSRG